MHAPWQTKYFHHHYCNFIMNIPDSIIGTTASNKTSLKILSVIFFKDNYSVKLCCICNTYADFAFIVVDASRLVRPPMQCQTITKGKSKSDQDCFIVLLFTKNRSILKQL